jgi:UDP-4-amino-4,6-dideoxy-N-acetyl-beta-L-altrosamine N-acetyltransferase
MGLICNIRKIESKDLEILRMWRNSDFVRSKMFNKSLITEEQQQNWFVGRDESTRIDFIIENRDGLPIGSTYIFDISQEHKRAEWGFYLGCEEFTKGGHALDAMILIYKYGFEQLNLEKIYCQTLSSNLKVVNMHKTFGLAEEGVLKRHYFIEGDWDDVFFMSLYRGQYTEKCAQIEKLIKRFYR